MTATIEQEVKQLRQEQIDTFVMPKPCVGQSVQYYRSGTRVTKPQTVFVREVGKRNIVVQLPGGMCMESVLFIDDPKLDLNEDQRANGAWDFTDNDKAQAAAAARLDAVEERLKTLEELLDSPKKSK